MNVLTKVAVVATALLFALALAAQESAPGHGRGTSEVQQSVARTPQAGHLFTPPSSIERPEDAGVRFHTNYVLHSFDGMKPTVVKSPVPLTVHSAINPDITSIEEAETPDSMGCLYVHSPNNSGCVPTYIGGPSSAGWGAIALVDAYDNPDAASDLATFDAHWGLAAANFTKVYANGNGSCITPPPDKGWAGEESLDIEWAHVFAPKAAIILVEACSSSSADLFYAEQVAFNYVASHGGGQISNSWGGGEFSGENSYDELFSGWYYNYAVRVVFFASAGDSGCGAAYPSVNPWLVSAGGTSVLRNSSTKKFYSESCWGGSGGGVSKYETYSTSFTNSNTGPWADYQYPIFGQANRATPDMSFNADPASGVWVYSQYGFGGWSAVGGTSVSSPSLAGIVNRAGNKLGSWTNFPVVGDGWYNNQENVLIYSQLGGGVAYKGNFYDIKTGSNGCSVTPSWDYCTGVGSPRGLVGK
jgi:kumamolisin